MGSDGASQGNAWGSQVGVGVIKCFVLRMVVGLKTMRGLESDRLFLDGMHLIF